jgi:SSS family solute:Na+ symporter
MALAFIIVIIMFKAINNSAVINELFTIASYTYGPLLGLYAFGLFTKRQTRDRFTPFIAILAPLICYVLSKNSEEWLWGYKFSFELLILNGLLMFLGLMIFSERKHVNK